LNRLWVKLVAVIVAVVLIGVGIVAVLSNRATTTGFSRYVSEDRVSQYEQLAESLAGYYARQRTWEGAELLLPVARGQGAGATSYRVQDAAGAVVASSAFGRGRQGAAGEPDVTLSLTVGDAQVGTLTVYEAGGFGGEAGSAQANAHAEEFLSSVNQALVLGGLAAIVLALLLGVFLAQRLTRPLRQLTAATRSMARGELRQEVTVTSGDEIGELAASFNQMAQSLSAMERQRQQLLADIAHELRTPLSVMRGHVEAMLDGVFEATPENLTLVHEESVLLGRLVDELRTLSLVEAGQLPLEFTPVDMRALLRQAQAAFEPLAEAEGVALMLHLPAAAPEVRADASRLQQVLGNLIANALRHAPQGPGKPPQVDVTMEVVGEAVRVSVQDNGPGLAPEALVHVFDRFWRADPSRSRAAGGSGLGLAIARGIVEAHGGRIWVESEPGAGASFRFEVPAC
jgi:signal transduction histidine kinase